MNTDMNKDNLNTNKNADILKMSDEVNISSVIDVSDVTNNATPQFPLKLPGSIWGISTFFNPAKYTNKIENYKIFRQDTKRQGLKLCVVELAFDDVPFELNSSDAEILIQIRGSEKNILWQKEALLNIALKNLPNDCDKIIWIDCDIIFANNNWIAETSELLEKYVIVQPFSVATRMPKIDKYDSILNIISSTNINKLKEGRAENEKIFSAAYMRVNFSDTLGHPGYVWAARRSIFENIGFYDRMILGTGDAVLLEAFYSPLSCSVNAHASLKMKIDIERYAESLYSFVRGSVYYCNGAVFHLWHGDFKNRRYDNRYAVLKQNDFDPNKDVKINSDGLLEWSCDQQKISGFGNKYFIIRKEDSKLFIGQKFFHNLYYLGIKQTTIMSIESLIFKKDMLLGLSGQLIKRISPRLYIWMSKRKPKFAKSLIEINASETK